MTALTPLPLAVVMVAGPQILSAIFLATSEDWRRNSAAFVFGACLSISLIVTIAFLFGSGTPRPGGSRRTLHLIVFVLLLFAMVHVYLKREQSEPPKWMGKLASANPRFSFRLGFLLLGFFPTDLFTSVAVGTFLSANSAPLTDSAGFIFLTVLFLALPSLMLVLFGERAEALLPKIRTWMNTNSWIVNEVVILFFIAMTINNIIG
ncbi:GAP family protein [Halocatena marina]|uniref:GAP family protein n=1 Tax=Halocatena marina TaxID=2934937 RepID=A0ABD5YPJ4_9EURY|nr:GAP family protein [Halocatena marina]